MPTGRSDDDMESPAFHCPVLVAETLQQLDPVSNGVYLDATLGEGGHAAAILESSSPTGRVFGIDLDPRSLDYAKGRLSGYGDRFACAQGNYADMVALAQTHDLAQIDGLVMDLGFSARQVRQPGYGFSFRSDEPLDMRFDPASPLSAEHIVNTFSEKDLAQLIFQYGQEPRSRAVARNLVRSRPVHSTGRLAELVTAAVGRKRGRRLHPATRTFQALRIAVNDELGNLESGLNAALQLLSPGASMAVISYHKRVAVRKRRDRRQDREGLHGAGEDRLYMSPGGPGVSLRPPADTGPGQPADYQALPARDGVESQQPQRPHARRPAPVKLSDTALAMEPNGRRKDINPGMNPMASSTAAVC